MKGNVIIMLLTACLLCSYKADRPSMLGKEIPNFTLRSVNGKNISLADYKDAKGFIIIFTCDHCPFAKLYTGRLNALNAKYKKQGVPLLAINSMDTLEYEEESITNMSKKARDEHYNFPYLSDAGQQVLRYFQASHTPQAFVIWKEQGKWMVKYKGTIDDNGKEPRKATPYVANAVEDLLHHKIVSVPETRSFGCGIHYRQ